MKYSSFTARDHIAGMQKHWWGGGARARMGEGAAGALWKINIYIFLMWTSSKQTKKQL